MAGESETRLWELALAVGSIGVKPGHWNCLRVCLVSIWVWLGLVWFGVRRVIRTGRYSGLECGHVSYGSSHGDVSRTVSEELKS